MKANLDAILVNDSLLGDETCLSGLHPSRWS